MRFNGGINLFFHRGALVIRRVCGSAHMERGHIPALLLDPFYGVQGKFLKNFWNQPRMDTNRHQSLAKNGTTHKTTWFQSGKSEAITGSLM
jgi:hypothetical protein